MKVFPKSCITTLTLGLIVSAQAETLSATVDAARAVAKKTSRTTTTTTTTTTPTYYSWMSSEIQDAWNQGYMGQGVTIFDVDQFSGSGAFSGNFTGTAKTQLHGYWTRDEISLISPQATIKSIDFNTTKTALSLSKTGLNVVNASYGLYATTGYSVSQLNFGTLQNSVINSAKQGTAVVAKAAGNYAVAVDGSYQGTTDYMNLALKGATSAIYVGALNKNGTTTSQATLASYSNYAGTDSSIQSHFLVVGVQGSTTGLYGTSFAAPVISSYSAIIGSKFKTANATQITNQLLNTARKDTISNYSAEVYGQGEASLTRALAPVSIK